VQVVALPAQAARADGKVLWSPLHTAAVALCHGPAFAALAIQRDIQCAVVVWVDCCTLAFKSPGIVG